jgi:hypothetical protein
MSQGADIEGMRKALISDLLRLSSGVSLENEAAFNALTAYIDMLREVHAIAAVSLASPPLMFMRSLNIDQDGEDIAKLKKAAREAVEAEDAAFSMQLRSIVASFCEDFGLPDPMDRQEST